MDYFERRCGFRGGWFIGRYWWKRKSSLMVLASGSVREGVCHYELSGGDRGCRRMVETMGSPVEAALCR